MSNILKDERFAGVLRDPKFKKPRKHDRKVQIDKRFQSMFKSDAFKVNYSIDKRGRRVSKHTSEDLERFYDLPAEDATDSSTSADESESDQTSILGEREKFPELSRDEDDAFRKKQITPSIRAKLKDMKVDYARGEGKLFSDSSSDESESEESEVEELYHEWNELDKDADLTNDITNRLAVCNMDWDRIRAVDLMVLFNSFLPSKALIHSVVIYPSEFGLKRMAEEEIRGPAELITNADKSDDSESDEDEDEESETHMERTRQYQLNRLKYYYAVITFDSPETADHVYTNCNGIEYESSGNRLDLRFIDDETTFDQEPKDSCDSLDKCRKYEPAFFTTSALQQAKVNLTWDETDPRRLEFTRKISEAAKNNDINDSDLENFVALSSSDEEDEEGSQEAVFEDSNSGDDSSNECESSDEEEDPIEQYKNLLKEIEDNEKDQETDTELEITWGADGHEASKTKISKKTNDSGSEKDETPFEQILRKNKEKSKMKRKKKQEKKEAFERENEEKEGTVKSKSKKNSKKEISEVDEQKKKELELLLADNDNDKHHFNLKKLQEADKKKKKKRLKKKDRLNETKEDDFQVDVHDPRFSALYSSHLFNVDPTNPKFTKTKGMNAFVEEKQRRITNRTVVETKEPSDDEPAQKKRKDNELSFLVKSIKSKTRTMLPKKTNKSK